VIQDRTLKSLNKINESTVVKYFAQNMNFSNAKNFSQFCSVTEQLVPVCFIEFERSTNGCICKV
jgi:CRISPR/Cas system CMR-associated protein Cmr1 (group 7 of RAMP superfamily)